MLLFGHPSSELSWHVFDAPCLFSLQYRMDVVSTERPRLPVRPMSDARFEVLKNVLGVDDEMRQVRAAVCTVSAVELAT